MAGYVGYSTQQGQPGSGYESLKFLTLAPNSSYGYFQPLAEGYANAARNILEGSQGARAELTKSYEEAYRHAAEGIAGAQHEYGDRLSGEAASQGYSPELIRRMLFGADRSAQAQIGSVYGQTQAGLHSDLAQLFKGTGTELVGLERDQMSQILQAYLAKKAREESRKAGLLGFTGGALGSVLGYVGSIGQGAYSSGESSSGSSSSGSTT